MTNDAKNPRQDQARAHLRERVLPVHLAELRERVLEDLILLEAVERGCRKGSVRNDSRREGSGGKKYNATRVRDVAEPTGRGAGWRDARPVLVLQHHVEAPVDWRSAQRVRHERVEVRPGSKDANTRSRARRGSSFTFAKRAVSESARG